MKLNRYLDHAVLIPELPTREAEAAIRMGTEYEVRTVCVRPCDIIRAKELCKGSDTAVCTVLNFPHGSGSPLAKAHEAELYARLDVDEVDMVANYGWLISGRMEEYAKEIKGVLKILRPAGIPLKVILESGLLSGTLIKEATNICAKMGVEYVKTSTGFNGGGSTVEAVQTMLDASAGRIKVTPSGGILNTDRAELFIKMGCQRLGVDYTSTHIIMSGEPQLTKQKWGY